MSQPTKQRKHNIFTFITYTFLLAVLAVVLTTITGCNLERDEHTVQFQQLQQSSGQDDALPVWMDVYSRSVIQDVYSSGGGREVLP